MGGHTPTCGEGGAHRLGAGGGSPPIGSQKCSKQQRRNKSFFFIKGYGGGDVDQGRSIQGRPEKGPVCQDPRGPGRAVGVKGKKHLSSLGTGGSKCGRRKVSKGSLWGQGGAREGTGPDPCRRLSAASLVSKGLGWI